MGRFFMQLRDGVNELLDPDGVEFSSHADLRGAVLHAARDILTTDLRLGVLDFRLRIDVEDDHGVVVHSLRLEHAVNIITDHAIPPGQVPPPARKRSDAL